MHGPAATGATERTILLVETGNLGALIGSQVLRGAESTGIPSGYKSVTSCSILQCVSVMSTNKIDPLVKFAVYQCIRAWISQGKCMAVMLVFPGVVLIYNAQNPKPS